MRRTSRLISAAVLIALASALTGCGSTTGWDPTDLLDFLDTKKKLPGDRKPVFPEGVPGLEQGVPKNLYRGAVEEPQPEATPAPVEEAKPKRASKPKARSKPAVARAPAQEAEPAPEEDGSLSAAPPAPKPAKQSRRRTTAPPPDEPAAATTTTAPAPSSAFPAPLPGGSFQR
ncbi:outer membrane biosynthesis protein TonB [Rhodopseudomonas rhenobacensis]|uniref:Outer membrane biosynthesis protein TonB n=1 Tax=Rhodopseudomonas rhenobacensis TaxID=87461 RepID=A0A7W7Z1Z5_9BRAD|nr:hypothetical protein [Rhodopseudomonas rhenobacensis]MBB5046492.1 outer membrane biosynthesis protein TonB [Rhodopseudomonas rhenobacensis]